MAGRQKSAAKKSTPPLLDWKIVARVRRNHVELVRVPLEAGPGSEKQERVIQILRGPRLSKRGPLGHLSILTDTSGQRALQAFRLAVRQAKKQ